MRALLPDLDFRRHQVWLVNAVENLLKALAPARSSSGAMVQAPAELLQPSGALLPPTCETSPVRHRRLSKSAEHANRTSFFM